MNTSGTRFLSPVIGTDESGKPCLIGSRCTACGEGFAGARTICPSCCSRDSMESIRLAQTGSLYVYTIVNRSYPGVETPFVDVIVDLDDGVHLKGTLREVVPSPDNLHFGMRVRVVFHEAVPADGGGETYLTYAFVPDETQTKESLA